MTRPDMDFRTRCTRGGTPADYGNSAQAVALRRQLHDLERSESTAVYQEMCAAADRTRAEGGSYVKGNGAAASYGANGEPARTRNASSNYNADPAPARNGAAS